MLAKGIRLALGSSHVRELKVSVAQRSGTEGFMKTKAKNEKNIILMLGWRHR